MTIYVRNRSCPCLRCRSRGMMGGAILVTLGVLFLLENYGILYFDATWPVLLIVIGLLSFAARSASTEGHVQPRWMQSDPRTTGSEPAGDPGEVKP